MKLPISRKTSILSSMVLLVLAVFGVFSNGISNGFVWDDEAQIVNNPWIKDIRYLGKMFSSDVFGYYQSVATTNYFRPVAHVFYSATWHGFGLNAAAFHLVNLVLHAGATLMVYLLVLRLLTLYRVGKGERSRKGGGRGDSDSKCLVAAFAAALFFAVHPAHAEAVDWISGIMELAFTLFGLLSFYFFVDLEQKKSRLSASLSVILFLLALFSKETAIVFLPLFFLHDLSRRRENSGGRITYGTYIAYLAAVAVYFSTRIHALNRFAPVDMHPELSTYECVINVFPLLVQHLWKLVWPVDLNVFHVFHPVRSILEPRALLGVVVSCCYVASLYWSWKRDRLVFFALVSILVPLLPLFYIKAISPILFAEQHLYLPSLGLALLVARVAFWAASRDTGTRYVACLLFVVTICFFSLVTLKRNPVWKDNLSLWSDAVEKSPESAYVHESLAGAMLNHGRTDEAIMHYRVALEGDPAPSARTYNNLGVAYSQKGWTDKAIESFSRALSIRPEYARAHIGLGIAYFEKGWTDRAIEEFRSAIELDPYLVDAYHNLGVAYAEKGDFREAEKAMKEASRLSPGYYEKR